MKDIVEWLDERLQERPWWMNAMMITSAFLAYVYVPWDFFFKPLAEDQEAWFGILLTGWAAKLTEPLHFLIYAAGAYGFWRMRSWMWPWAAAWTAQLALGMFLWPILYRGGAAGWALALLGGGAFGIAAWALYGARDAFVAKPLRLKDRYGEWAVVTGASSGIGREFARALAAEGMSLVVSARRKELLEELAAEVRASHGVEVRVIPADLAEAEGQRVLVEAVEHLPIGILVANAGFGLAGPIVRQPPARLREMVELNCQAPVALVAAIAPEMVARARGAVIVVGSVAGRQAVPLFGVYAATKAFDLLLGEALWAELRPHDVDVLTLLPGPVATEFEQNAGETRENPRLDEQPDACVAKALEALGRQPVLVSGGWATWFVANLNRIMPRWLFTLIVAHVYAQQVPADKRS
jgi:short-subunit dehydrogenase